MLQLPFLYLVYLLPGIPDGSHFVFWPGCGGRMWEKVGKKELRRCGMSSALSVFTATALFSVLGPHAFAMSILAPWLVLSFWLFMVTYLQHHSNEGKLYARERRFCSCASAASALARAPLLLLRERNQFFCASAASPLAQTQPVLLRER
jgi:fatty acid desaturase